MTQPLPAEPTIEQLLHDNKRLRKLLDAIGLFCDCCWTNSWTPTEHGDRCECCWLHERWMSTKEELEEVSAKYENLKRNLGIDDDGKVFKRNSP